MRPAPRAFLAVALLLAGCSGEDRGGVGEIPEATREGLARLGYAEWSEAEPGFDPERRGVVHHDPTRAWPGLNLYKLHGRSQIHLMDMEGALLHTWHQPRGPATWPLVASDAEVRRVFGLARKRSRRGYHGFEALPDGDLVGFAFRRYVERIGWNGELRWRTPVAAHHDVELDAQGRLLVLTDRIATLPRPGGGAAAIVDNDIAVLDAADGRVLERIALSPIFGPLVADFEPEVDDDDDEGDEYADVFHTNAVELVPRDLPGVARAGHVLLSVRELDLLAMVDLDAREIVWSWGPGELSRPHDPSLLPDGHLLVFDNRPAERGSRVLELDPVRREIVWEYRADPPGDFHSPTRGSARLLPNGNVLVAEADRGRAFEVTREGEIVWEFLSPRLDREERRRTVFYRFERVPFDFFAPGLLAAAAD